VAEREDRRLMCGPGSNLKFKRKSNLLQTLLAPNTTIQVSKIGNKIPGDEV
jgi:hypothetical protein